MTPVIVLKLPADAADHPYLLAEIVAGTGALVSKGDPVFKLVRAGTQRKLTFRAPLDGTVGAYLVGGTDLLAEPGLHIVTMEKAQEAEPEEPAPAVAPVELYLPDDPALLPAQIKEWLVSVGDHVTRGQPVARLVLADGRPWDITAMTAGRVTMRAAENGAYITQMARLMCKVAPDGTDAPASQPSPEAVRRDLCSVKAENIPEYYPMSVIAWHIAVGDHVGENQVVATLRRANGDASRIRSSETGRVVSLNVAVDGFFGVDDVLYGVDRADVPPQGWQVPADPPLPQTRQKAARATPTAPAQTNSPENGAARTPEGPAKAPKLTRAEERKAEAGAWVFFLGMGAIIVLVMLYISTGSRVVFGAGLASVLLLFLIFAKGAFRMASMSILVVFAAILMALPQEMSLPPNVPPWEPFGIGTASPDGARHGDFWENMTRPQPTKQQQERFDAWLEG